MYKNNFTPADRLSVDEHSMAMYDLNERVRRLITDQAGGEFIRLRVDMKTVRASEELKSEELTGDKPSASKPSG